MLEEVGPSWLPGVRALTGHNMRTAWVTHCSRPHGRVWSAPSPQRKGFLKAAEGGSGWAGSPRREGAGEGEDSNLGRRCKAFLSEHFQAYGRSRLRYRVLLRGVLGPLGLQGGPGQKKGKEGETETGREGERERESRRDTHRVHK